MFSCFILAKFEMLRYEKKNDGDMGLLLFLDNKTIRKKYNTSTAFFSHLAVLFKTPSFMRCF